MGFETIHQPKSKDVFSFRVFPWNSVAILMLSCPTVAYTSGSERCVLHSVFFRVRPWLILLLILGINSVANASAFASASFRGKCFCLCLRYPQIWAIPSFHINQNRRNGRSILFFLLAPSFYLIIFIDVVLCFIWCLLCTDNPLDS